MSIKMQFTGDILCQMVQTQACSTENGLDYSPVLKPICKRLMECDYLVGNLETPVAGEKYGYTDRMYQFNTPEIFLNMLADCGFHLLSTANNHCMDRGLPGLISTLDHLDKVGLEHVGTYRSQEERDRPYIRELSGMRFGFLSYTYGTNAFFHHNYLSADNHWAVNLLQPEEGRPGAIDLLNRKTVSTRVKMLYEQDHPLFREHIASYLEQLKQDILALRKAGAEFLVMLLHCGGQHDIEPDDYTKWIVRWLDEQKVDLIIGNHQHILHPCVKLKHAFVAYCLGNLTDTPDYNPNGRGMGEEYAVLLQSEFEKFQGKVRMQNVGLSPVISVLDKHGRAVVYEVTDLISNRCKNGEQQSLLRDLAHFVNLMRGTDDESPVDLAPIYPLG